MVPNLPPIQCMLCVVPNRPPPPILQGSACVVPNLPPSSACCLWCQTVPPPPISQESACGCAGIFSAPVALALYATAFEQAGALDKLEAFASFNGPDFYGLPRNSGKVSLVRRPWRVPESYSFGADVVVPMFAGQTVDWQVEQA